MAARFPHATQNGTQFKTYESFISGILHVIFSSCSRLWVTELRKAKPRMGAATVLYNLGNLDPEE